MIKGSSSLMKRGDHRPESGVNKRGVKQISKMAAKKNGGTPRDDLAILESLKMQIEALTAELGTMSPRKRVLGGKKRGRKPKLGRSIKKKTLNVTGS